MNEIRVTKLLYLLTGEDMYLKAISFGGIRKYSQTCKAMRDFQMSHATPKPSPKDVV